MQLCPCKVFALSNIGSSIENSTGDPKIMNFQGNWGSYPFTLLIDYLVELPGHEY